MRPLHLLPTACAVALAVGLSAPAQAQSLSALYELARGYDASFQAAKSLAESALAKAEQAKAGLLPTAGLTAGTSRSNFQNNLPFTGRNYGTSNVGVSGSYPLYRPGNSLVAEQGQKAYAIAQLALGTAEQDLMIRAATAYFDVLASQDSLAFVKAQKAAVAEQLASAKRNFEVGTSTITDTREAQARYDLVLAQEIAAENDLRVKTIALETVSGKTGFAPTPIAQPLSLPSLSPSDVNLWVKQSEDNHPAIKSAALGLDVAQMETQRAQTAEKPTVDLSGSYGITFNHSGSAAAGSDNRTQLGTVGVSLNYPLFTGYATQNRIKETLLLEDKARNDLEAAKRVVAQATRTAYFGVVSGLGQVNALQAAETSSQSALDANKLGYQVGVRINIDVLNSQSQLFQTKRDLAKARYDVLVGGLRLHQANGTLKTDDLRAVSAIVSK